MDEGLCSRCLRSVLATLLMVSLVACSTMRPLQTVSPAAIHETVTVGDTVEVLHVNGRWFRFKVLELSETEIAGGGQRISLDRIEALQVKEVSAAKTAGSVVAVVGSLAALSVYLLQRALHSLDEGGES